MSPILPVQCWLARTALRWTALRLARAAGLTAVTVRRFERGEALKANSVEAIRRALDQAGVVFVGANDGGPGIKLRNTQPTDPGAGDMVAPWIESPGSLSGASPSSVSTFKIGGSSSLERSQSKSSFFGAERPADPVDRYHLEVSQRSSHSWGWEIYRNGEPLPVPLREFYYSSESVAAADGRAALREFLKALDRLQSD
jgi:transcriptional regulator with XRE-family HTH domain